MGISDFEQVSRLISKRFQKAMARRKLESADLKVAGSPCCGWISKAETRTEVVGALCEQKSYEMNKCLSLVHLTTIWIAKWLARDPQQSPGLAAFMADFQVPWGVQALSGMVGESIWKSRPSWYLVTTENKMIPPDAQRAMSKRAGPKVVEVEGRHVVRVSQSRPLLLSSRKQQMVRFRQRK